MGMLGNFVSGAAGAGASMLSQSALDDARGAAELLKTQRIMDMQAAQNEKLRAANADRVKGYFAPTEQNVAGAATAMDDDGNSTAVNDYTQSSPATLQQAAQRAGAAGDTAEMSRIHAMSDKDERVDALNQRSLDYAQSRKDATDARLKIASDKNDLDTARYLDADGNPVQKGKVSDFTNAAIMGARHESDSQMRRATQFDLELMKERKVLREINANVLLSDKDKSVAVKEQSEILNEIQKRRDEATKASADALARSQEILGKAMQSSNALRSESNAGNPAGRDGGTPIAKTMAERGAPADLASKFKSVKDAANSLDGNRSPRAAPPVVSPPPVITNGGMLAPVEDDKDYAFDGAL